VAREHPWHAAKDIGRERVTVTTDQGIFFQLKLFFSSAENDFRLKAG